VDRGFAAARRREEREEKRQQRELDRALKEQAKRSALEQARLEVSTFENQLAVLRSVHKELSTFVDWKSLANSLPPHPPLLLARNALATELRMLSSADNSNLDATAEIEQGQEADRLAYEGARATHDAAIAERQHLQSLARRLLIGESRAYVEALQSSSAFSEMSNLGSSIHFTVHSRELVECELQVNGHEVIPGETRSLSAGGKLLVRPMPKTQFYEVYQDYVCSCVLRLAREILALLPVNTVLVTATVRDTDAQTGQTVDLPILSVGVTRKIMESLNFEKVDPSAAIPNFPHRGEVAVSRKSGAFMPIVPLTPTDIAIAPGADMGLDDLLEHCLHLLSALKSRTQQSAEQVIQSSDDFVSVI